MRTREKFFWWAWMDLNHRPPLYKSGALTAELHAQIICKLHSFYTVSIIKQVEWRTTEATQFVKVVYCIIRDFFLNSFVAIRASQPEYFPLEIRFINNTVALN